MSASALSSESLADLRTSFQERKVRRRETFAWSWRIWKIRSLMEMAREPRLVARSVQLRSLGGCVSCAFQ